MINELNHIKVDRLVIRYLENEATSEEKESLLDWVNSSIENKKYFQRTVSILRSIDASSLNFDDSKAFESFVISQPTKLKVFQRSPFIRIAASIIIILSIGIGALIYNNRPVEEVVVVSKVETLDQQLPDKSTVILHKGSKIVYPSRFVEDTRHVDVQGQAFFDVEADKKKPFVINVGPIIVEVLGTSFDINLDTLQSSVSVTVESGKVKVTYPETGFVKYLNPKEQVTINWDDKSVSETVVKDNNYKGWITKSLVFDASPMSKVISDLNKVYDKKIFIVDDVINNCRLTAKIDNIPQSEILTMLEKSLNLEVIDNGEMFILIGEGCSQ